MLRDRERMREWVMGVKAGLRDSGARSADAEAGGPFSFCHPRSMDKLVLAMYPLPWFSFTKPWFADENSSQAFGSRQADPAIDLDVYDSLVPATPAGSLPTHSPVPPIWLVGWGVGSGGQQQWVEIARHLLHHHLRYNVKGGEAGVGEALLVLAHLDGFQPLIHRVKTGVVRDRSVQQWQVDAGGGAGDRGWSGHILVARWRTGMHVVAVWVSLCKHR